MILRQKSYPLKSTTYSASMRKKPAPRSLYHSCDSSFFFFFTSQHCIGVSEGREQLKQDLRFLFPRTGNRNRGGARASVSYIERLRAGFFLFAHGGSCHGAVCRLNELAVDRLAPPRQRRLIWRREAEQSRALNGFEMGTRTAAALDSRLGCVIGRSSNTNSSQSRLSQAGVHRVGKQQKKALQRGVCTPSQVMVA